MTDEGWNAFYTWILVGNQPDYKHKDNDTIIKANEGVYNPRSSLNKKYLVNYINFVNTYLQNNNSRKNITNTTMASLMNNDLALNTIRLFIQNSINITINKKNKKGQGCDYMFGDTFAIPTVTFSLRLGRQLLQILYQKHPILNKFMTFLFLKNKQSVDLDNDSITKFSQFIETLLTDDFNGQKAFYIISPSLENSIEETYKISGNKLLLTLLQKDILFHLIKANENNNLPFLEIKNIFSKYQTKLTKEIYFTYESEVNTIFLKVLDFLIMSCSLSYGEKYPPLLTQKTMKIRGKSRSLLLCKKNF